MNPRLSPHSMRMSGPVLRWQEAVPVGNGLLGALIFGHPRDELLQTNHCRLFEEPERIHAPNMEDLVPKLREGLLAGEREKPSATGRNNGTSGHHMERQFCFRHAPRRTRRYVYPELSSGAEGSIFP